MNWYRRPVGASLPASCLLLALILWIIAYQVPTRQTLLVGGDVTHHRRFDEDPFLNQINGSEPPDSPDCPDTATHACWWWQILARGERPYRWTSADTTAAFPGLGGGLYAVEIIARGQPTLDPTPSAWQVGTGPLLTVNLPSRQIRRYHILAPANASGDLHVTMRTKPFAAQGDPRELGFVLYELKVAQTGGSPRAPAWPHLGWLTIAIAAAYGTARILSVGPRISAALAVILILAAALSLALARPEVTIFTPILASMGVIAVLVALVGWAITRFEIWDLRFGIWGQAPKSQIPNLKSQIFARQVLALTLLALALRVGGMFHPHALYSDSAFHANKLFSLILGNVFQTAGLPSEAGGGQAPYPTGFYFLLLPGQLLLPTSARVALMQIGTAILDSLMLPLIALLIVRAGLGRRAALMGAACYLLPITALEAFSIGELANIGGQSIAMGFVALLALGAGSRRQEAGGRLPAPCTRIPAPRAVATLTAGLLAHSGVTLSLGAFTAAAWLISLAQNILPPVSRLLPPVSRPRHPSSFILHPSSFIPLTLIAALSLSLALLVYYSAPIYINSMLDRVSVSGGAARSGLSPLTILSETASGIFGLIPPRSRGRSLPPLLGILALTGLGLLYAQRGEQPRAGGLRLTLSAFWLGTLITQALLLIADQGVRWSLFLYPALCLSTGPLLSAIHRRGRIGRFVALAALGSTFAYGILIWIIQIRDYYHS